MEQKKFPLLYVFLGLVVLVGLLSFLFREKVIGLIGNSALNLASDILEAPVKANKSNLDLKLLSNKRFLNLKNQVVNFDYDNFGQAGGGNDVLVTDLETASSSDQATSTDLSGTGVASSSKAKGPQMVNIRVSIGNSSLFLRNLK